MVGKRFTWTNQQPNPILARLDRAFTNLNHNMSFPSGTLSALPYHAQPLITPTPILLTMPTYFGLKGPACCMTLLSSPRFSRLGHMLFPVLTLLVCLPRASSSRHDLPPRFWSRRFRAPPYIIPNCKFLIQSVDTFEEVRGLSPAEMQVRTDFRDRLPEALKEINTHLLEAEFGQFGKEMPNCQHCFISVRWRSME